MSEPSRIDDEMERALVKALAQWRGLPGWRGREDDVPVRLRVESIANALRTSTRPLGRENARLLELPDHAQVWQAVEQLFVTDWREEDAWPRPWPPADEGNRRAE